MHPIYTRALPLQLGEGKRKERERDRYAKENVSWYYFTWTKGRRHASCLRGDPSGSSAISENFLGILYTKTPGLCQKSSTKPLYNDRTAIVSGVQNNSGYYRGHLFNPMMHRCFICCLWTCWLDLNLVLVTSSHSVRVSHRIPTMAEDGVRIPFTALQIRSLIFIHSLKLTKSVDWCGE